MKKVYLLGSTLIMVFVLMGANGCTTKKAAAAPDAGVFKSTDFGENWKQKVFVSKTEKGTVTIGNVATSEMMFHPHHPDELFVLTAGSGIYRTTDAGEQWKRTTISSGTYKNLSIDRRNSRVMYATQGTKISKTVDDMQSWKDVYIEKRPGQTISTVLVDPFRPSVVYAATKTTILKSTDYGITWNLLPWEQPTINELYISEVTADTLLIRSGGKLFRSTDGAVAWTEIGEGLKDFKGGTTIHWIQYDPKTDYIILGTSYGILRTFDLGVSWQEIPTLFEQKKVAIKTVISHPADNDKLIFSVGTLLYKTDDAGVTWKTLKTVPTSRSINFMISHPEEWDTIYLGVAAPPKKK